MKIELSEEELKHIIEALEDDRKYYDDETEENDYWGYLNFQLLTRLKEMKG